MCYVPILKWTYCGQSRFDEKNHYGVLIFIRLRAIIYTYSMRMIAYNSHSFLLNVFVRSNDGWFNAFIILFHYFWTINKHFVFLQAQRMMRFCFHFSGIVVSLAGMQTTLLVSLLF